LDIYPYFIKYIVLHKDVEHNMLVGFVVIYATLQVMAINLIII